MKVELVCCEEEEGWAESVEDKRRSESEVRELVQKKKGLRSFMSEHMAQRLAIVVSHSPTFGLRETKETETETSR